MKNKRYYFVPRVLSVDDSAFGADNGFIGSFGIEKKTENSNELLAFCQPFVRLFHAFNIAP